MLKLVFGFPAPIILALILNEVQNSAFKRTVQTISYLPHFLSWVVLSGIIIEMLSPQRGIVGYLYTLLGMEAPVIMYSQGLFRPMLVVSAMWQGVGWGTIVYLAAIAGINPELYESATVDGANRLQMAVRITVPSLIPVIVVLFILNVGGIMEAGFDQILNLYNPLVFEVADHHRHLRLSQGDPGAAVRLRHRRGPLQERPQRRPAGRGQHDHQALQRIWHLVERSTRCTRRSAAGCRAAACTSF